MSRPWLIGEVFHHKDDDGRMRHFVIPLLRQSILDAPRAWSEMELPLNADIVNLMLATGGAEEARINAYPAAKLDEPGIGCLFYDGKLLLVDGNHRLVKRFRLGLKSMKLLATGPRIWETCLADPATLMDIT